MAGQAKAKEPAAIAENDEAAAPAQVTVPPANDGDRPPSWRETIRLEALKVAASSVPEHRRSPITVVDMAREFERFLLELSDA